MKYLFSICLLAVLPASALEERTFHNADKSKSFLGEAVGYNSKTDTVTVKRTGASEIRFKVSLLSEEDQEYIRENAVVLAVANATSVTLKEFEGEQQRTTTEVVRSAVTPTGYSVTVKNGSSEVMEEVTADYTIYYRKGSETGKGKISESTGTLDLYAIYPKKTSSDFTGTVSLERMTRSKSGGGWGGGPVTPGGRRADELLGCKIEVKVGEKVVKTHYSDRDLPEILEKG